MTAIYIAGASGELDRCESAVAYARSLDLRITHDWTADVRANLLAGKTDRDLTDAEVQRHALADLRAVSECRVLVLLAPAVTSTGCWGELCFAIALRKRIVISREFAPRRCIFETIAHTACATDTTAITLAKMLAQPAAAEMR